MISQPLKGLTGQGMNGRRRKASPLSWAYAPGSYTFTPTKSGWYRFVLWGPGGYASAATSSGGALVIAERPLIAGQPVAIVVGNGGSSGVSSTITLPNGEVLTAGQGVEGATAAGGVAVGRAQLGDTLVNGTAAGGGVPGSGASSGNYRGATGLSGNKSPGAGSSPTTAGGDGLCLIHQTRMRTL